MFNNPKQGLTNFDLSPTVYLDHRLLFQKYREIYQKCLTILNKD